MKALVCGGRDYNAQAELYRLLDSVHRVRPITKLIEGGAKGADHLAGRWAKENGIPVQTFKANWSKYGKAAGMIRNKQMLVDGKPDLVIAFPGGRGTAGMMQIARAAGVVVMDASILCNC